VHALSAKGETVRVADSEGHSAMFNIITGEFD
jgi:hypothetical protein